MVPYDRHLLIGSWLTLDAMQHNELHFNTMPCHVMPCHAMHRNAIPCDATAVGGRGGDL